MDKEQEFLESLPTEQANRYLRIIFSAKESIFKCFFPISQTYLYFQDAEIIIDDKNSEFSFYSQKHVPVLRLQVFNIPAGSQ